MSTVFSFENPRRFTTDANQKLRRFCPPFSQLRTLCIGKHTFPTPLFVTSPRLMHASYYIPGSAKFGTIFRGVKPIPTSTTYTTPLFGLSSTKEGNQKKTHTSLSAARSLVENTTYSSRNSVLTTAHFLCGTAKEACWSGNSSQMVRSTLVRFPFKMYPEQIRTGLLHQITSPLDPRMVQL